MPWSNQSGGPWRSPPGPWGSGPQSNGPTPTDLEELLRRGQDRLRTVLPGGGLSGRGISILVVVAIIAWLLSGFYRVQPDEQGVVLRFGKFVQTTQPGLNYHLPYPIESVLTPKVTRVNRIDIGMRVVETRVGGLRDVPEESLMLTGDENIVDVDFSVFWLISDAGKFLFNIQNQEQTIKAIAESTMREVVGRSNIQPILTGARQGTETAVQELMQQTLNEYNAGVTITQVQLQKVDPPNQVIDAFRDVQAARADQERMQNEARSYANTIVPQARGQAAQIQQVAASYKQRTVNEAQGQAARFDQILTEYQKAPEITRKRLFLETMERVLASSDKIIIDDKGTPGVIPYLPLNEVQSNAANARRAPAAGAATQPRGDAQ